MVESLQAPPRRVRQPRMPNPSFDVVDPPVLSDCERANVYSHLLTGGRDDFQTGDVRPTPRELLACLHRYLVLSEPRVPVHQFVIDDITVRAMMLVTGTFVVDEEGEWLWDTLFGQGIANVAGHQGPYCGVKALQYYGLLGKAAMKYMVPVPPDIALHLMATLVDDMLIDRRSTATHLTTSFPQRSSRVFGFSGSVTVPASVLPPDDVTPSEEPTIYFDWALRSIAGRVHSRSAG